ncbi:MAG: hypothetical protein JNM90_20000 [Burkholderiales bacterium]|nr:hypothetical protein [Burkholderiales bacterium]
MRKFALPALLAGLLSAGCDGLFTGENVARFPLSEAAGGGYAPLRLTLGPEMNPIALNLHAEYAASDAEAGKWNSYRATLSRGGSRIATGDFNVNNTSSPSSQSGQAVSRTMLVVEVGEVGDYEITIVPTAPIAVTLHKAQVELRRNIRREAPAK